MEFKEGWCSQCTQMKPEESKSLEPVSVCSQVRNMSPASLTTAQVLWQQCPSSLPTRDHWRPRPAVPSASQLVRALRPSQNRTNASVGQASPLTILQPAHPGVPASHCLSALPVGALPCFSTPFLPPQGLLWWGPMDPWPLASQQTSILLPPCSLAQHAGTLEMAPLRWTWLALLPPTPMCYLGTIT